MFSYVGYGMVRLLTETSSAMNEVCLAARIWYGIKVFQMIIASQGLSKTHSMAFLQLAELGRCLLQPTHHSILDIRRLQHSRIPHSRIVQALTNRPIPGVVDNFLRPQHRHRRLGRNQRRQLGRFSNRLLLILVHLRHKSMLQRLIRPEDPRR